VLHRKPAKSATDRKSGIIPVEEICELGIRHSSFICGQVNLSPIQNLKAALHNPYVPRMYSIFYEHLKKIIRPSAHPSPLVLQYRAKTRSKSSQQHLAVCTTDGSIYMKTQNPKCRLYWCFIEFIDWRYSQPCW
jgi:hypothetical protein